MMTHFFFQNNIKIRKKAADLLEMEGYLTSLASSSDLY